MEADFDALDVFRREIVLAAHGDQRIDGGVGIAAARIRLYADLHRFINVAETGHGLVRMRVVAVTDQQAVLAFDRFRRADESLARQ
ncbi:Uncharacterised protein [Mycobacterium tuberculosis]|nr:Uncharacterised protein [Mycobacterium tuberculosis]